MQNWKSLQKWQVRINKWFLWLQGKLFHKCHGFVTVLCPSKWPTSEINFIDNCFLWRCFLRPTHFSSLTTISLSSWTLAGGTNIILMGYLWKVLMKVVIITTIILRLNQCYHHQQHHDQDYDDNHHQLEWDVCEQCEAEQSRSRERINGGFYRRYP